MCNNRNVYTPHILMIQTKVCSKHYIKTLILSNIQRPFKCLTLLYFPTTGGNVGQWYTAYTPRHPPPPNTQPNILLINVGFRTFWSAFKPFVRHINLTRRLWWLAWSKRDLSGFPSTAELLFVAPPHTKKEDGFAQKRKRSNTTQPRKKEQIKDVRLVLTRGVWKKINVSRFHHVLCHTPHPPPLQSQARSHIWYFEHLHAPLNDKMFVRFRS